MYTNRIVRAAALLIMLMPAVSSACTLMMYPASPVAYGKTVQFIVTKTTAKSGSIDNGIGALVFPVSRTATYGYTALIPIAKSGIYTATLAGNKGPETCTLSVRVTGVPALPSDPVAVPAPGAYAGTQSVSLSAASSTSIRYTLDGTTPSCAVGTAYAAPISVTASTTIRAIACNANGSSAVGSFSYAISNTAQSVSITAPRNTGVPLGTTTQITWSSSGYAPSTQVNILLVAMDAAEKVVDTYVLGSAAVSDGTFTWNAGAVQNRLGKLTEVPAGPYRIRITDAVTNKALAASAFALAAPAAGPITISLAGTPEVAVAAAAFNGCNGAGAPDAPAHAFVDAGSVIHVYAVNHYNFPLTGTTLNTLSRSTCTPLSPVREDIDPSKYAFDEWYQSPYTIDGKNVVIYGHEEFHGARLVDANGNPLYPDCVANGRQDPDDCWYAAVVFASSTDSGNTFSRSADTSADVTWTAPSVFTTDMKRSGGALHSNVFRSPADGYYYMMVRVLDARVTAGASTQPTGNCLLRSATLDASSWRAWDGTDFTIPFGNPYAAGYSTAGHVCKGVNMPNVIAYTIVFSPTMNQYIAIGRGSIPLVGKNGVVYSTSSDLINWSSVSPILNPDKTPFESVAIGADGTVYPPGKGPGLYWTLLDETSAGRNFEDVSDAPYLYYMQMNLKPDGTVSTNQDRDLMRVRLAISSGTTSPVAPVGCVFDGAAVAHGSYVTAYQSSTASGSQMCTSELRFCSNGTLSGSFSFPSCVKIESDPIGSLDVFALNAVNKPYVSGWAFDPDASSTSLTMRVSKDGIDIATGVSAATASAINARYGITGAHRYSVVLPANSLPGTYRMYAMDSETGAWKELQDSPHVIGSGASCVLDGVTVPDGFSKTFYSVRTAVAPATCATSDQSRTCADGVLSGSASYQYASCTNATSAETYDSLSQMASVLQSILSLLGR